MVASADFNDWPTTRITALVYNAVVTIAVLVHWLIHRHNRTQALLSSGPDDLVSSSDYLRFRFWPCGRDSCFFHRDALEIRKVRSVLFCCCFPFCACNTSHTIPIQGEHASAASQPYELLEIPAAVLGGCLAGLWLHFWPCIWWTCDWGDHDDEGIRGAIWFATWAVVTSLMLCLRPRGVIVSHGEDTVWFSAEDPQQVVTRIMDAQSMQPAVESYQSSGGQ